jgi:hypothetical protein
VEKVDGGDGEPLVDVFALGQRDGGAQVAGAEGGGGAAGARRDAGAAQRLSLGLALAPEHPSNLPPTFSKRDNKTKQKTKTRRTTRQGEQRQTKTNKDKHDKPSAQPPDSQICLQQTKTKTKRAHQLDHTLRPTNTTDSDSHKHLSLPSLSKKRAQIETFLDLFRLLWLRYVGVLKTVILEGRF